MPNHYITLHVVRRALHASLQQDVFRRRCAVSSVTSGIHRSTWIEVESHKRPHSVTATSVPR